MKLDKQVSVWAWIGRVAPLSALLLIGLVLTTDLSTYKDYIIIAIAVGFGPTAFFWWWWVIYAVKSLVKLLDSNKQKFDSIVKELKNIRKDMRNL